ncbi:MAG: hypothetical protein WA708_01840 [Acidobacteriaceae bacterium]
MKFFEGCRPEFYFHGGKLTKDAKSGKQFWKLNLVLTLRAEQVLCCDDVIKANYVAIETRENRVEEIKLADMVPDQVLEFFSLADHKAAVLRCGPCDLTELRLTREDDLTELWVKAEIENSDEVHTFVRQYVFQRLWVEFAPRQMRIGEGVLGAMDKLTSSLRSGDVTSMSISSGGKTVTLDKEAAENIHKRAKKDRVQ